MTLDASESVKSVLWATPTAVQNGNTVETYLRKSIKRIKQGGQPFAPILRICVELAEMGLSTSTVTLFDNIDLSCDTEIILKKIPLIIEQMSLDCSEMESCPTPQNEHSENCGEISAERNKDDDFL